MVASCPREPCRRVRSAFAPQAEALAREFRVELRDGLGGPARPAVIDGGTHASDMSHPAEVTAEMLAFLRQLDQS